MEIIAKLSKKVNFTSYLPCWWIHSSGKCNKFFVRFFTFLRTRRKKPIDLKSVKVRKRKRLRKKGTKSNETKTGISSVVSKWKSTFTFFWNAKNLNRIAYNRQIRKRKLCSKKVFSVFPLTLRFGITVVVVAV